MKYDIIVIGFGKAGKTLAAKAGALGKKVALIERSPQMYGGTCINIGCIPTKRLVTAAKEAQFVNNNVEGDYYTLSIQTKDKLITALRAKNLGMLKDNPNIDVIDGVGYFLDKNSVEILTADGSKCLIDGDTIVINTGSKEADAPFEVKSDIAYTSSEILNLKTLPKHLVVVGNGFIGLEFASMFAGFGSKVTIIGRGKFMKNEDDDVANSVKEALVAQGIEILEDCNISSLMGRGLNFSQGGMSKSIIADAFLLAMGRKAVTEGLNLDKVGVKIDEKGNIVVNEFLQTDTPNIYAVGDVRGGELFTYTSLDDFRIVFDKIFGKGERSTKNRAIHANTLFTQTPLDKVGHSKKHATALGKDIKILKLSMSAVPGAKVVNHDIGMLKAIVDSKSGEILGAAFHCIYAHEIINEVAIAMNFKANASFFKNQIFTHPSISEALNDLFGQF